MDFTASMPVALSSPHGSPSGPIHPHLPPRGGTSHYTTATAQSKSLSFFSLPSSLTSLKHLKECDAIIEFFPAPSVINLGANNAGVMPWFPTPLFHHFICTLCKDFTASLPQFSHLYSFIPSSPNILHFHSHLIRAFHSCIPSSPQLSLLYAYLAQVFLI